MMDPGEPFTNLEARRVLRRAAGLTGDYVEPDLQYEGDDEKPVKPPAWVLREQESAAKDRAGQDVNFALRFGAAAGGF